MLTRNSQIGEFYVMAPPQVAPMGTGDVNLHTCDIMIYDEESDKHVRVTWRDALEASCVDQIPNAKGGNPTTVSMGNGATMPLADWKTAAEKIAKFNEGEGEYETIKDFLDIRIVVARPFIEHLMHNVILAVAGRETGATLFGPADMQLSVS